MQEKYGFIYRWYDCKRDMYYIGCHWGTEGDGYICSSNRMRNVYKRRPQDFNREILMKVYTNRVDLLEEEHKWLQTIPDEELGIKFYNHSKKHFGHWTTNEDNKLTIREKISKKLKEKYAADLEFRETMIKKQLKLWQNEEYRKNQIESHTGYKYSEERKKTHCKSLGRKHTEETKRKLREIRKKQIPPTLGMQFSEEWKRNISLGRKRAMVLDK